MNTNKAIVVFAKVEKTLTQLTNCASTPPATSPPVWPNLTPRLAWAWDSLDKMYFQLSHTVSNFYTHFSPAEAK